MKLAAAITTIAGAAAVGTYLATKSASPLVVGQRQLPFMTNVTLTNLELVFPDAYYVTNFDWFYEIADEPAGPWRLPDRQHPEPDNWVIRLNGARYIRMHGVPY